MKINESIRALREDHDLTQQEIADLLLLDRKTYNRAENGSTCLSIESLIKLADYYRVSLDKVVGRNEPKDATINKDSLFNAYQGAAPRIKKAIKALLDIS